MQGGRFLSAERVIGRREIVLGETLADDLGVVLGELMGMGSAMSSRAWGGLATMGMVVTWISTLMLLIGLAYLVVNGWWIRRALCRPPPVLDEILDSAADQAGPADSSSP